MDKIKTKSHLEGKAQESKAEVVVVLKKMGPMPRGKLAARRNAWSRRRQLRLNALQRFFLDETGHQCSGLCGHGVPDAKRPGRCSAVATRLSGRSFPVAAPAPDGLPMAPQQLPCVLEYEGSAKKKSVQWGRVETTIR